MDWNRWDLGTNKKSATLTVLLVAMSLVGPAVAYAGVDVIWPESTNTVNINQDPPIQFDANSTDFRTAQANNFTGSWTGSNNNASYTVTVSGLSGGNVTIDKWLNVSYKEAVDSYDINITDDTLAAVGPTTLTSSEVNFIGYRVWDASGSAPTTNTSASVLCWVNLENASDTGTADNEGGTSVCETPTNTHPNPDGQHPDADWNLAHVQIVVDLKSGLTTDEATIGLQPLRIQFA